MQISTVSVVTTAKKTTYGTCKVCFVRRGPLTHNVKHPSGRRMKVCRRCAGNHTPEVTG